MSRWIYSAADSGRLNELDLDLEPGQEFEAPDEWLPEPNPHPVYRPASVRESAPAPAQIEE